MEEIQHSESCMTELNKSKEANFFERGGEYPF